MKFLLEITYDNMYNAANSPLLRALSGVAFIGLAVLIVWFIICAVMALNAYKDKIDAEIDCMVYEEVPECEEEIAESESMR